MTEAREEVLRRVREAIAATGAGAAAEPPPLLHRRRGEHVRGSPALTDLLRERLVDYRAEVLRCDAEEVGEAVQAALDQQHAPRAVVPPGLPEGWRPRSAIVDDGLDAAALDEFDAVVTGTAVAVAETGTVVLDGSPLCGRRAITLVPDLHVCVVRAGDIVQTVPEALALLDTNRPLTFVSGPSATSDIELDRVEGVHGPRRLIVVIAT